MEILHMHFQMVYKACLLNHTLQSMYHLEKVIFSLIIKLKITHLFFIKFVLKILRQIYEKCLKIFKTNLTIIISI